MTKKQLAACLGIGFVVAVAAVLIVPSSRYALWGVYRGERFEEGMPASYWVHELADTDEAHRQKAVSTLARISPELQDAVPALTAALKDDVDLIRVDAALAIFKMQRAEIKPAVPSLCEALRDRQPWVRMYAVLCLHKLGADAASAKDDLVKALQDDSNQLRLPYIHKSVREMAAFSLGRIGEEAGVAAPALRTALKDTDVWVRLHAAWALWRITGQADESVPVLLDELNDRDADVRWQAVLSLGEIGPKAHKAVAVLVKVLKDRDQEIRREAGKALKHIDPDAATRAGVQ